VKAFGASGGQLLSPTGEALLPHMMTDLRDRHVALEVGVLPLTGQGQCGFHVEGYSAAGQPLSNAKRLKAAGVDVRYFGMDEPLFYGHIFKGPNSCHSSVADIAKDVAEKFAQVRSVYPHVPWGDVEPMGIPDAAWLPTLEEWFDAFEAATGQKLAFFRVDIQWASDWRGQMKPLSALLRRKGIPLQVIYNGAGNAGSDAAWVAQATQHFKDYETSGLPRPDAAVFQSWTANPTHVLPESDPQTMTGLIEQYVQWNESRRR
jgi:hypothetical protein